MYRITDSSGKLVGLTERLVYITEYAPRCYTVTTEEKAGGILYQGNAYRLTERRMVHHHGTVSVSQVDGGAEVSGVDALARENAAQLAQADETAIDLYENQAMLDESIIELYEMIGG